MKINVLLGIRQRVCLSWAWFKSPLDVGNSERRSVSSPVGPTGGLTPRRSPVPLHWFEPRPVVLERNDVSICIHMACVKYFVSTHGKRNALNLWLA